MTAGKLKKKKKRYNSSEW